MAKTFQTCIAEARELLQDTDTDQRRYTDATLLGLVNRGIQEISRIRPDLTYSSYANNSLEVPEIVTSMAAAGQLHWTARWPWELWFYNRLVDYIVGVAEIMDDEYTTDGRAALLLQTFRNSLIRV